MLLFIFSCKTISNKNIEPSLNKNRIYVSDAETAKKIAEAIWIPIYGEGIYDQRPYIVELKDGLWYVRGTFYGDGFGGVAYITIRAKDCKLLEVYHTK
jgi:hypothetical protein